MENCLFSVYGISITHPLDWRVFLDPKRGFNLLGGFIRIENYTPRVGAEVSISINWDTVSSDSEHFPQRYCDSVEAQYHKQFKKKQPYGFESAEIIDFCGQPAAYVVSTCTGNQTLSNNRNDRKPVKILQLAFYHEGTGRAVVGTVLGKADVVSEQEEFLKEILFSLRVEDYEVDCRAIGAQAAQKATAGKESGLKRLFGRRTVAAAE